MQEGGVDEDDEEDDDAIEDHHTELSEDEDDMDDEDHDVGDDEGSHEDSIIDMLEEQQMEEQVDRGDGWTTDTDSIEEGEEEMDDEDSPNDELVEFPPVQFPNAGEIEEDGVDYSEEELDEAAEMDNFYEMARGQFRLEGEEDEEEDEEEEDEHHHHHHHHHHHEPAHFGGLFSFNGRQYLRQTGVPCKSPLKRPPFADSPLNDANFSPQSPCRSPFR
jgi:hypothetical protein